MSFFRDFAEGVHAYERAVSLLFMKQFRWFLWFPFGIAFLLFFVGNHVADAFAVWVEELLLSAIADVSWLDWFGDTLDFLVPFLVKLFYFLFFFSFGGYVVMILMSPVNSWLSERVEAYLSGKKHPFSWKQWRREMFRGIGMALRCMAFQVILLFCVFLLSFVPLVGLFSSVLFFLITIYFYGMTFMDYAIERKGLRVQESMVYMYRHAGLVMGIGVVFTFALLIPFIRIVTCCFVPLLAVIAGTVVVVNQENKIK